MFYLIFSSICCRDEKIVGIIVVDTYEKMSSYTSFLYHGKNICLQWKTYMLLLVHKFGS